MDEKQRIVSVYKTARFGMPELCRELGISGNGMVTEAEKAERGLESPHSETFH
jgi:hypothetical protein